MNKDRGIEFCNSCKYFVKTGGETSRVGYCVRFPPRLFCEESKYPRVSKNGWCGEYKWEDAKIRGQI